MSEDNKDQPQKTDYGAMEDGLDALLARPSTSTTATASGGKDNGGGLPPPRLLPPRDPRRPQLGRTQSHMLMLKRASQRRLQHHRHHTSLGEYLDFVSQDAKHEMSTVSSTLKNELEDADAGRMFFMDMNMTRSLSILPEDLEEFVEETANLERIPLEEEAEEGDEEPSILPPEKIEEIPTGQLTGFIMLMVAVLAVSSNGTALHLLYNVPPPLKLYWRMTATAALLFFFVIKGSCWNHYRNDLTTAQMLTFGAAIVAFAFHTLLLYTALDYTTIGNAVIYGNSQALLLIVGKLLVGQPVTVLEGAGVITAFTGAILCSRDSEGRSSENPDFNKNAVFGDLLALASAVAGVAYLTFAKSVRSHVSVTVFIFLVMFLGSWLVLLYMIATRVPLTLDRDPHTGLFGWMTNYEHHIFILLHIAVVCNVLGTMGFVRAMQFFDTITIAVGTLLEPLIAAIIAYIFHVGLMPGLMGYFGNALVTIGTIAVVSSSKGGSAAH